MCRGSDGRINRHLMTSLPQRAQRVAAGGGCYGPSIESATTRDRTREV